MDKTVVTLVAFRNGNTHYEHKADLLNLDIKGRDIGGVNLISGHCALMLVVPI